jgi:hypothetical protein
MTPRPAASSGDASPLDRLWGSLGRVVSVTREGEAGPGDPAAPVEAVGAALRRGDLDGALALYDALPEPARQAGSAFASEAKARQSALATTRAETARALGQLSPE